MNRTTVYSFITSFHSTGDGHHHILTPVAYKDFHFFFGNHSVPLADQQFSPWLICATPRTAFFLSGKDQWAFTLPWCGEAGEPVSRRGAGKHHAYSIAQARIKVPRLNSWPVDGRIGGVLR